MAKKVAVVAVNPVNGYGLFHYLEQFFENEISFKTFAVADTPHIKTNSGIALQLDDTIANLKGCEGEFDALVFACGDAMPKFGDNVGKPYNQDLLEVIKAFADKEKILAGHCAAALLFDGLDLAKGKKVALHPYVKNVVKHCVGTDMKAAVEGKLYTAQTENTLSELMPQLLAALR